MINEQVQHMVRAAIHKEQPDPARFYHLCWWQEGIQCLHAHHTTEPHPVFLTTSGQVLTTGLSIYQWKLVIGRILYYHQIMDLPLDTASAESADGRTPARATHGLRITDLDWRRLATLLADVRTAPPHMGASLEALRRLLVNASVVPAKDIPADVVTMNSQVRLWDEDDRRETLLSLVFPADARGSDFERIKLSILTQTGMAMLGRKVGDRIEGRLRIAELLYQPEAAGDFTL